MLVERSGDTEDALAGYERNLFARSGEVAEASARNLVRFFGEDTPRSVAELFTGRTAEAF